MENLKLRPGDVVLVQSTGIFPRLIRWATRQRGELPTVVNHVGIMVSPTEVVESAQTVLLHHFWPGKNTWVARYKHLTPTQRQSITRRALLYVGRKYGWLKIVAHAVDFLLFRSRYVVRRFLFMDNYPICSWVVAYSYDAAGLGFGVPINMADPDSIWDWIMEKPSKVDWEIVLEPSEVKA